MVRTPSPQTQSPWTTLQSSSLSASTPANPKSNRRGAHAPAPQGGSSSNVASRGVAAPRFRDAEAGRSSQKAFFRIRVSSMLIVRARGDRFSTVTTFTWRRGRVGDTIFVVIGTNAGG